jgi:cytochrome c-type biogenesis protein CcmH/NrfG
MTETDHSVNASRIEESISMLAQYLDAEELAPLLSVLRELAKNPDDGALLDRLSEVFENLGLLQGAVLTYAPIIAGFLSDDPFSDRD